MGLLRRNLTLTPQGFQTAEAMLEGEESAIGQLRAVWTILRDMGCGVMANIVYRWIA